MVLFISGETAASSTATYKGILNAITVETSIPTTNPMLNELFTAGGMVSMLGTIWLILSAMIFGGVMDAIGGLQSISNALLKWAKNTFQLFPQHCGFLFGHQFNSFRSVFGYCSPWKKCFQKPMPLEN